MYTGDEENLDDIETSICDVCSTEITEREAHECIECSRVIGYCCASPEDSDICWECV